jgi:hypothetical protein
MRDFLIQLCKVLIALLAIPSTIALVGVFFMGLVVVGIAGILLSPIGLVCFLKEKLRER